MLQKPVEQLTFLPPFAKPQTVWESKKPPFMLKYFTFLFERKQQHKHTFSEGEHR